MPGEIINGRELAAKVRAKVSQDVADMIARGIHPGLTVILVGEDPASQIYVGLKEKACREVGIESQTFRLPADTPEEKLLGLIRDLNQDPRVHGILVQVPLPPPLREKVLLEAIDPLKDVDCFHPTNVGRLVEGKPYLLPCTPAGIMEMIRSTGVDPRGKEAVMVGRSNIVGKPTAQLLLAADATVTVAHSKTQNLAEVCRRADILVVAVGKPALIRGEWIKPGAVVIDVGMNRVNGKVMGDVAYDEALPVAGHITPVPGGSGPMTIAMLMRNVATAAQAISGQ